MPRVMLRLSNRRTAFTLVELVVVVAVLAIVASVGGVAFAQLRARDGDPSFESRVQAARRDALRSGVMVQVIDSAPGRAPRLATAFPDGRVVADRASGGEWLAGRLDTLVVSRSGP